MPGASRHAKPKSAASRLKHSMLAAVALASVGVAVIFLHTGAGAAKPATTATAAAATTSTGITLTAYQMNTAVHREIELVQDRAIDRARSVARRRRLAAAHRAQLRAAQHKAAQNKAAQNKAAQPTPASSTTVASSGSDAASSPLGVCVRDTEEGGSYAWGRGNGGGAYQFLLATWEKYGGAASEYGVAGPAYQNQIFDNAVAEGGASNWTNYDGC
jgi:hypothetical protein